MEILPTVLQLIVAGGILNVWVLRYNKSTPYRGGSAKSMREEFAAYGLPFWFLCVVGALKIGSAISLAVGVWVPELVKPAAGCLVVLMLGALIMHIKVKDPMAKSVPAFLMLILSSVILYL